MRCGASRATRASAISPRWASAAAAAGQNGAAYFGVSPMHMLFPHQRGRASPYHPSDRRFLDPILIDALAEDGLPVDEEWSAAAATLGERLADVVEAGADRLRGGVERQAHRAAIPLRRVLARPRGADRGDPLFAEFDAFIAEGGENLLRFAVFDAIHRERNGEYWRLWPEELRDADAAALAAKAAQRDYDVRLSQFCQWVADRQLGAAAERARAAGLDIGLYRDLAVGSAPDGAESWSRAAELGIGATVGAPPDTFSPIGPELAPAAARSRRRRAAPAGRASANCSPPTCATPACCASTTRWA